MDWIERWLGVSPDGGDGSLELLLLLLSATAVLLVVLVFSARARVSFLRLVAAIVPGVLRKP